MSLEKQIQRMVGGYPAYIYGQQGQEYLYFGIIHSPKKTALIMFNSTKTLTPTIQENLIFYLSLKGSIKRLLVKGF